jgi:GNAT superfamily N-acetyltransferase
MPLPPGFTLRDATTDDLPAIVGLREAVDWAGHDWAVRAVIGQPDAAFILAEDATGQVAAMGSGIAYPPSLGFIGNMVVAERHRRRGLGSAILDAVVDRLTSLGCHRFELNATDEGRPLYERHGFVSRGESTAAGISRRAIGRLGPGRPVRPLRPEEVDRVVAYDRPRFGGDRSRMVGLLASGAVAEGFVAERDGGIEGFAFLQHSERRIGPMVADSPEVAAGLVAAVFEAHPDLADVRLNLPPGNVDGAAWLRRVRVAAAPWTGRMARGPEITRRDETIYQMTVGPLG